MEKKNVVIQLITHTKHLFVVVWLVGSRIDRNDLQCFRPNQDPQTIIAKVAKIIERFDATELQRFVFLF